MCISLSITAAGHCWDFAFFWRGWIVTGVKEREGEKKRQRDGFLLVSRQVLRQPRKSETGSNILVIAAGV